MPLLLAIDPGVTTGWASFSNGLLYQCDLGEGWPKTFSYQAIIEYPQIYPHTNAKQANDLIKLAIQVGRYAERMKHALYPNEPELVLPHTWKGNVPKPVHHLRVWDELTNPERSDVLSTGERFKGVDEYLTKCLDCVEGRRKTEPSSRWHNMFDAVGLGLWKLGRLK